MIKKFWSAPLRSIAPTQRSAHRVSFAQLVQLFEQSILSGNTTIHPSVFFERWIGKIYGAHPGEQTYRQACLTELMINLQSVVTKESIVANWRWDGDKQQFPNYLPAMLFQIHQRYSLLDVLGLLPKRSLQQKSRTA